MIKEIRASSGRKEFKTWNKIIKKFRRKSSKKISKSKSQLKIKKVEEKLQPVKEENVAIEAPKEEVITWTEEKNVDVEMK